MAAKRKKARARGRPTLPGQRHPNGRLVWRPPEPAGPTPEILARRAELVGQDHAKDPDAEWLIGRMRLNGQITASECEAGRRYRDTARRLERMMAAAFDGPRHYKAFDPRPGKQGRPEVDDDDLRRTREQHDAAFEALTLAGWHARRAVANAVRDEPVALEALKVGLEALRAFYRLPPDREPENRAGTR